MSRVQFRNYNIVYGDDAQPYSHTDFEFINTSVRIMLHSVALTSWRSPLHTSERNQPQRCTLKVHSPTCEENRK